MKRKNQDPRTKLLLVLILSSFALIYNDLMVLLSILGLSILIALVMDSDLRGLVSRLKRLIYMVFVIALVQSLFTNLGNPILSLGKYTILTDYGIKRALEFIIRISIVIVSSSILATSSSRHIVQALIQMKVPYEIAFMVSIAIRFLPIFKEEMTDSIIAIELRGIDLKKSKLRDKIRIYKYIFLPIIINSSLKARDLSLAMEMKGFRAYDKRTSFRLLKMQRSDYIIISLSLVLSLGAIIFLR